MFPKNSTYKLIVADSQFNFLKLVFLNFNFNLNKSWFNFNKYNIYNGGTIFLH